MRWEGETYITIEEAACVLGVGWRTVQRFVAQGRLEPYRLQLDTRRTWYKEDDVKKLKILGPVSARREKDDD